ncbi:unnamed protein product [Heterobilharzia americana]|nr:unnamed protein product [Heterobilharzia americana]
MLYLHSGLYTKISKERCNPQEVIHNHSIHQSIPVKSIHHHQEYNQNFRDYSPTKKENIDFASDLNDINNNTFNQEFHGTYSSGFHSPTFSIHSNSPDIFEKHRNQITSNTYTHQSINLLDNNEFKKRNFSVFENPCEIHQDFNSNRITIHSNSLVNSFPLYCQRQQNSSPQQKIPFHIKDQENISDYKDQTNNFTNSNKQNMPIRKNEGKLLQFHYTKSKFLSEDQNTDKEFTSYDVGLCKRCNKVYNKYTIENDDNCNIFPNSDLTTQNNFSSQIPSKINWKPNFSSQQYGSDTRNYYSTQDNYNEFQEFINHSKVKHYTTTDPDKIRSVKHCSCCVHNYFRNLNNRNFSQPNYKEPMNQMTKSHSYSFKNENGSHNEYYNLQSVDMNRQINHKLNETFTINIPHLNNHNDRFHESEEGNQCYCIEEVENPRYNDNVIVDLRLKHKRDIQSPVSSHFKQKIIILKQPKVSNISTQTDKQNEECQEKFCRLCKKQKTFNTESVDKTKAIEDLETKQRYSSQLNEQYLPNETILTSDCYAHRQISPYNSENQLPKALATSTPLVQCIDYNKTIHENKSSINKSKFYYSFQMPKSIPEENNTHDITNSLNETAESFITMNLLKVVGKSISLENINYIDNEE